MFFSKDNRLLNTWSIFKNIFMLWYHTTIPNIPTSISYGNIHVWHDLFSHVGWFHDLEYVNYIPWALEQAKIFFIVHCIHPELENLGGFIFPTPCVGSNVHLNTISKKHCSSQYYCFKILCKAKLSLKIPMLFTTFLLFIICNGQCPGCFWAQSVKIPVILNPTNHMLTSSARALFIWGILFYRFFYNDR